MFELKRFNSIFFVGIGGIGMSAIARYFFSMKKNVAGYDKTETTLTKNLQKEGINIHFKDEVNLIPEVFKNKKECLIVFTPAIPKENKELNFFIKNNFFVKKRAEVLGMISENFKTIAVSGTHGKTTISTMIAHILKNSEIDCDAFLGGISKNYNSNLILRNNQKNKNSCENYVVIEADEYDKSFHNLSPEIAVLTSLDKDHLDIYVNKSHLIKSYNVFIKKIKRKGFLIKKNSINLKIENLKNLNVLNYSLRCSENSDFYSENIVLRDSYYYFDFVTPKNKIYNLYVKSQGFVNLENTIASLSVAYILGVKENEMKKALKNFLGVKRRFEYKIKNKNLIFIDDYAHHPEELKRTILSIKEIYTNKKITGIFQPHLYSRTKDFAKEFAENLDLLDKIILMEIYPARELKMKNVSSKLIFDLMKNKNKILSKKEELLDILKNEKIEILVTFGAGDIDKIVPKIEKIFFNKNI